MSENGQSSTTQLSEAEFTERVLAAIERDPANRDRLLAQTAFQVTELHRTMLGAFAAIQSGGMGGIMSALGGFKLGRNKEK